MNPNISIFSFLVSSLAYAGLNISNLGVAFVSPLPPQIFSHEPVSPVSSWVSYLTEKPSNSTSTTWDKGEFAFWLFLILIGKPSVEGRLPTDAFHGTFVPKKVSFEYNQ